MSDIREITKSYEQLPLADRIMFYLCISNDLNVCDETKQAFLIERRMPNNTCIHCQGTHVVKNGHRADGTQRFICRDCHKSFILSSRKFININHELVNSQIRLAIWRKYIFKL